MKKQMGLAKRALLYGMGSLLALGTTQGLAQVVTEKKPVIEIGAGALTSQNGIDALLRVEIQPKPVVGSEMQEYLVLAKVRGDIARNAEGEISYLDVDFQGVTYGWQLGSDSNSDARIELSTLNLEALRDISIGNGALVNISFIGASFQGEMKVSPRVEAILNATVRFLGVSLSDLTSQVPHLEPTRKGNPAHVAIGAGLEFNQKFRVLFTAKASYFGKGSQSREFDSEADAAASGYDSPTCGTEEYATGDYYVDEYGETYEIYESEYSCTASWTERARQAASTSLRLEYDIGRHLRLFGMAEYSVFRASDTPDGIDYKAYRNSRWNFRFGGSYRF